MTIIGVIAAMTVPTLISKYQKHTYVVGPKKAYSILSNAMKMIPITEGCPAGDYDCAGMNEGYDVTNIDGQDFGGGFTVKNAYLLSKNLTNAKFCAGNNYKSCIGEQYDINRLTDYRDTSTAGIVVMSDGTYTSFFGGSYEMQPVRIDINGAKGPNIIGRDIFELDFVTETRNNIPAGTVIPSGSILTDIYFGSSNPKSYKDKTYTITGKDFPEDYTAKVLEEDAMNY